MINEDEIKTPIKTPIREKITDFVSTFMLIDRKIAANMLMAMVLLLGITGFFRMNSQTFPDVVIPDIKIITMWQGASAGDVDKNIVSLIEPEVRYISGVKEIVSSSREGIGIVELEFEDGTDMQEAIADVENAVTAIADLPSSAEKSVIKLDKFTDLVANVAIIADKSVSEKSLKKYAKLLKDGLVNAGVGLIEFKGYREEKVTVEVDHLKILKLGLSVNDVANAIRNSSLDRSSGLIEGAIGLQLRTDGTGIATQEIGDINVIETAKGEKVALREIATIKVDFNDYNSIFSNGKKMINIAVQRAKQDDALEVAQIVAEYTDEFAKELPKGISINVYDYRSKIIKQRISLLVSNGIQGFIIVAVILFIFLSARAAFWIAVGIPIAIISSLAVLFLVGESINMLSLFVMIMMLGIAVDDAIIIGEHSYTLMQQGYSPREATIQTVRRMFAPVMAAMLTTIAGFAPIFVVGDVLGQFLFTIPVVVICVIIASTFEAFMILPGHIRHSYEKAGPEKKNSLMNRFRKRFDHGFNKVVDKFAKVVTFGIKHPYLNLVTFLCLLSISFALLFYDKVKFEFFPSPESESFYADIYFQPGVSHDKRVAIGNEVEKKALEIIASIPRAPEEKLLVLSFMQTDFRSRFGGEAGNSRINFQLTNSEERTVRTKLIVSTIKARLENPPDVRAFDIGTPRGGPPGKDIDIAIGGNDNDTLKKAALELKEKIALIPGTSNLFDDLPYGTRQLLITLKPRAKSLGFTTESITNQLRADYDGVVARAQPSDDGAIDIRVKVAGIDKQGIGALREHVLRAKDGNLIQLAELVELKEVDDFGIILREAGLRSVKVLGDIDLNLITIEVLSDILEQEILPPLREKYSITTKIGGRDEEEEVAFEDLGFGLIIALASIYVIIALVFDNYFRPLAVMSIIPFGMLGAILGHLIMGHNFTILSMIASLALSGILVNDSIVYLNEFDFQRNKGFRYAEALVIAAKNRSRAIVLTSLTTIGGLTPLMFEKSLQAQFLIPMTITIVFGLATATVLILLILPSVMMVGHNLSTFFSRVWRNLSRRAV